MRRTWHAAAALVTALLLAPVMAAAETYCVGGFQGQPPEHVPACNMPAVAAIHGAWHDHIFLTDGTRCYDCWDEVDNTCSDVFLATHPNFREIDPFDCARMSVREPASGILFHVVDGRAAIAPPASATLTPKIETVGGGPFGAGDDLQLVGSVRDGLGRLRPVNGGRFTATLSDGSRVNVVGVRAPDGTMKGRLRVPSAGRVRVEFAPELVLADGELMYSSTATPLELQIQICDLRAELLSPEEGEPLLAGQEMSLRVALRDEHGAIAPPPDLELRFDIQEDGQRLTVQAERGATETRWTPPHQPKLVPLELNVGGRAGTRTVCPTGIRRGWISDAGWSLDTSGLPTRCYTGLPCRGTAVLRRPAGGAARAILDAALADPATQVFLVDTGADEPLPSIPAGDRFAFERVFQRMGNAAWSVRIVLPSGRAISSPSHEIVVRPALQLQLPGAVDFGEVAAGTPVLQTCKKLDFSSSQAAEEHRWRIAAQPVAGCASRPVLAYRDAAGAVALRGLEVPVEVDALDPLRRWLDVCLVVPPCAGELAPPGAALEVSPLTPEFADLRRTVAMRWTVRGRSLLACHGWWLLPLLAVGATGLVLGGTIGPSRFPDTAAIRVAGSERNVRRAESVSLRDCPGAGAGWWRSARLGLHGSGDVTGRVRNALVVFRATRRGVVVTGHGPLELQDRRTGELNSITDLETGYVPVSGDVYRAGDVWFILEDA